MSRIGYKNITIPDKVKVNVAQGGRGAVEGPRGKLEYTLPTEIKASVTDKELAFKRENEERATKALHGLARSLVNNMVAGVTTGFVKDLEIQGVGLKAALQGDKLNLSLGKSHPILFPVPAGIKITVTENTKVKVEGIDKQLVGQVAANIRGYYPPEPYKGKGVSYAGENVQRKEGKTVQKDDCPTFRVSFSTFSVWLSQTAASSATASIFASARNSAGRRNVPV